MMIEKVMIQLKARGGWGGRQPPPMMIEKVMIQSGAKSQKIAGIEKLGAKNLKSSGRMMIEKSDDSIRGKTSAPPMMIEKVMIQLGPRKYLLKKSSRGVISSSAARPHGTSEDSNIRAN